MNHIKKIDIYRYLDKECSDSEQYRISEHLKSCSECNALYSDISSIYSRLNSIEDIHADDLFTERIVASTQPKPAPLKHFAFGFAVTIAVIISVSAGVFITDLLGTSADYYADNSENTLTISSLSDTPENTLIDALRELSEDTR
ncbi:MAG: zf-HC2 domain-containing protein [candidate division WOR-3 bacterium]|nr:zf-HC2 domain-containing protein [candidate division WOR-3 bacterium]